MLLTSILVVPFVVGLLCLFARPRALLEFLNIAGFATVLGLGVKLCQTVLANPGSAVSEVERIPARRRPQRVDGAAHLGRVAGDRRSTPGATSAAIWRPAC